MYKDIRWLQRFKNFKQAFGRLRDAVEYEHIDQYSELEKEGIIQRFEYTYELAWNTLKDYFEYQGETNLNGSRDVFRMAFQRGIISEGEIWMKMIDSRQRTSHTYNSETAEDILENIINIYYNQFKALVFQLDKEAYGENTQQDLFK